MATKTFRRASPDPLEMDLLRLADGYMLDASTGLFAAAPVTPKRDLTPHAANSAFQQFATTTEAAFSDGYYIASYYFDGTIIPAFSEEIIIADDAIAVRARVLSRAKTFRRVHELPLEMEVIQLTSGKRLDDTDGSFQSSPASSRVALTSPYSLNTYIREKTETRSVWSNGLYAVLYYLSGGASPIDYELVTIVNDLILPDSDAFLMVSGSTSVRQLILTALAARLATILVANGYRTNLGQNVEEWDETPLDPDAETFRIEYRDEAGTTEYESVGAHLHTMPVTLRIVVQNNTAGSALSTIRNAVADVYQAIHTDVTFGGLAHDTNQDGAMREDYGERADRAASAEVKYKIEYTTVPGTP